MFSKLPLVAFILLFAILSYFVAQYWSTNKAEVESSNSVKAILEQSNIAQTLLGDPQYVWSDELGLKRQSMVYFRFDTFLESKPLNAEINLFVDSRYHLIVNGQFVNFGPSRSFPESPEYDTYNLLPYLVKGKNIIAVKALSNGMNTYQLAQSSAGFIAWGEIVTKNNQSIVLSTPGNWKQKVAIGYDDTAAKFSFTSGAVDIYDARKELFDWKSVELDNSWTTPVLLANQKHWGKLSERIIPHLTQDEIVSKTLVSRADILSTEDLYGFKIAVPDLTRVQYRAAHPLFAYSYVYSPKAQTVSVGTGWGDFYLNGKKAKTISKSKRIKIRENRALELKKGWNFLFANQEAIWGSWSFYLSAKKEYGLIFSSNKDKNSLSSFMYAGPFLSKEYESVRQLALPFKEPSQLPASLSAQWQEVKRGELGNNPAFDIAWRELSNNSLEKSKEVTELSILPEQATSLVYDIGKKTLGRVFVEFEAPKGTVIDIAISEHLNGNRPFYFDRFEIYSGFRYISKGGVQRFETFKPYGFKFVEVQVLNHQEEVTIKKVGAVEQIYPFNKTGWFESSDDMLNQIWDLGWKTLQVCSEDSYTDTPWRERGVYAGDIYPEFAMTLATSGDTRLLKKSLLYFQHLYKHLFVPNVEKPKNTYGAPADFPLITLQYLKWYYDWTDDKAFIESLYPAYKHLMLANIAKQQQENGLYLHEKPFIEWTKIDKKAQLTTMHSLIARSYKVMAELAKLLDKGADEKEFNDLHNQLKDKINKHFWEPELNAYRDGDKNNMPINNAYPISSAWPLVFDITSEENKSSLCSNDFFENELVDIGNKARARKVTPYGSYYVLGALYQCNKAELAENFIRKHWTPMVKKGHGGTWEDFSDDSGGTLSHAWSGSPTYYLSTQVLGVQLGFPEAFNRDKLIISPYAETIEWAKGAVPHPKGLVEVDWKIVGNQLLLNYTGPKSLQTEIRPRGRLAKLELWVNGKHVDN